MTDVDTNHRLITSQDQIPDFDAMSKEDERIWWETHEIAEGALESGPEIDEEFERLMLAPPPQGEAEH
jgi:hypothetical protein